jgi:small conductance mechanosensitive channel
MLRRLRNFAVLAFLLLGPAPALAQNAAPAAQPASPAELQNLVATLQDDAARAKFIQQLQALIAAQQKESATKTPDAATLFGELSERLNALTGEILATAAVVIDAPRLIQWVQDQASDSYERARWLDAALKLGIIFGFALFAEWVVRTALLRPRAIAAARPAKNVPAKLAFMVLRAIFDALPIITFAGVAYAILPLTQPRFATERVALIFIHANLWARILLAFARTFLLPMNFPRFLGLNEETRTYLFIWTRRFVNWTLYGLAVGEGAWWFGVPGGVVAIILKSVALVLMILAVIFVLQNRVAIAQWMRGRTRHEDMEAGVGVGTWRLIRNRLADIWHVLAIVYIVGIWCVYALRIEGGFLYIVRATALSLVVIAAARIIVNLIRRASRRGFAIGADVRMRFPTLEARANRYLPILTAGAATIVYGLAFLTVLQAWDIASFAWFDTIWGRHFTGALVSVGAVILVALIAWEIFSSVIERYLSAVDDNGQPLPRSARTRTLLPLLRTATLVLLVVMVSLIVLSELGVNIAPLLAGAGVVGLAIGFGSQALVKDIITGLFILIEDTISVGDVADVGNGHSGFVEAITIRTIRMRDMEGTVHTVPFSAVTTVKNLTKDFAFYVADIRVAYREDTDHVIEVAKEVAEELRSEPEYRPLMLEPLEVVGVDQFDPSAVIVKVRLKTLPIKQWMVGREFNRRLKKAFDRHGIEMPYPHQTIYFGENRRGEAPAAHIQIEDRSELGVLPSSPRRASSA